MHKHEISADRRTVSSQFDSLAAFAQAAWDARDAHPPNATLETAVDMAVNGWSAHLAETLDVAESAVELVERNHEILRPDSPVYDVCGDSVDMGRYMAGEPECMVDYPIQPTSVAGSVIALVAPFTWSGAISDETIRRRGQVVTALALALSRIGHSVELWADRTNSGAGVRTKLRVLVKGASEPLDPSRILFAYAHPHMLHKLAWTYDRTWPSAFEGAVQQRPTDPDHDLPDGTIYLPALRSDHDVPDAHQALKDLLAQIGLAR